MYEGKPEDVIKQMFDVHLDEEVEVENGIAISIMVRFEMKDSDDMAITNLGYRGEAHYDVENEEKGAFQITNSNDCTKGETDLYFGQIPRIIYYIPI
jgi:hypothetical protein